MIKWQNVKIDTIKLDSKYLVRQFNDYTVKDNIKSSFVLESSTSKDF